MRVQDVNFAPVRNSFPVFGAEEASADRGSEQRQLHGPVLLSPSLRCFIPEVNVLHLKAAPSVIKEMWRRQSSGLCNGFICGSRGSKRSSLLWLYPIFVTLKRVLDISLTESVMMKQ